VGRPLRAVVDTMVDLDRQVIGATLQAEQQLPSGSSFGGLRGGYARITTRSVLLHRFSFVPGVELEGSFPVHKGEVGTARVKIEGAAAARGWLRIGAGSSVSGVLGGHRLQSSATGAQAAGQGGGHWPGLRANLLPDLLSRPLSPLAHQP
jgi:hypothetical protein